MPAPSLPPRRRQPAVDLGSGLMAEYSAGSHVQHGCPQLPFPRGLSAEGRVGPGMQALPHPAAEPPFDRLLGETRVQRLLPGDDTCLALELTEPGQPLLILHVPSLISPAAPRHPNLQPVDNCDPDCRTRLARIADIYPLMRGADIRNDGRPFAVGTG